MSLLWNGDIWRDPAEVEKRCRFLGQLISTFHSVATDRLHIGILAAALGCQVQLSSSLGGKIPGVYEHTLCRFSNIEFRPVLETDYPVGEWRPRDQLLETATELAKLRREYYEPEIARLNNEIRRLENLRLEWFEPELKRRLQATESLDAARADCERRIEILQSETAAASQNIDDSRRQLFRHQRQAIIYARELSAATTREGNLRSQLDTSFIPRLQWLEAENQRLQLEIDSHRGKLRVQEQEPLELRRSLRMIGYVIFPFNKRRREKRERMLAALWK